MNRFLILLLGAIVLFSCGKDSDPDDIFDGNKEMTLQEYYDTYCSGYKVKDTTGLDMITPWISDSDNEPKLAGRRNEKLWMAVFDKNTKEQIAEFVDDKEFDLNQTVDEGYGEHRNRVVSSIEPVQFIIHEDGSSVLHFKLSGEDEDIEFDFASLVIFVNESKVEYSYDYGFANLSEWYNESYLFVQYYRSFVNSKVFDKYGKVIVDDLQIRSVPDSEMAVSYTDYIRIAAPRFTTFTDRLTIHRASLFSDIPLEFEWLIPLPVLNHDNDRYEYELISKNGDKWSFRINVTEYSGKKHSHNLVVNVETGVLISLD